MFDDIAPKNPSEPEDIFAGTPEPPAPLELKSALSNKKLMPVGGAAQPPASFGAPAGVSAVKPEIEITPPLLSKKSFFIVIGVILIVGLGGATAWGIYNTSKKQAAQNIPAVNTPVVNTVPVNTVNIPVNAAPEIVTTTTTTSTAGQVAPTPVSAIDTDGDGLTDEEEAKYGTNPQKADTDGDGLTDYEEIMIWKTDPLNPDTDGDGFLDGVEVKNGYNPLGSGKLLELPAQ